MKRSVILFGFLVLLLAVFPIVADQPAEEVPEEPAVEEAEQAAELETEEEGTSSQLLPEALLSEPQPAASCSPFQCRQQCRQGCSPGCFCFGSCVNGVCECDEICF